MIILNHVQVNLIYNTNRNLFLWIEIFLSITDLYNTTLLTDGPATCRIGIKPETGSSVQMEDVQVTYALHL